MWFSSFSTIYWREFPFQWVFFVKWVFLVKCQLIIYVRGCFFWVLILFRWPPVSFHASTILFCSIVKNQETLTLFFPFYFPIIALAFSVFLWFHNHIKIFFFMFVTLTFWWSILQAWSSLSDQSIRLWWAWEPCWRVLWASGSHQFCGSWMWRILLFDST